MTKRKKDWERRSGPTVRCQFLSGEGKQCYKRTASREYFHGDPEVRDFTNDDDPSWVLVALCSKHTRAERRGVR